MRSTAPAPSVMPPSPAISSLTARGRSRHLGGAKPGRAMLGWLRDFTRKLRAGADAAIRSEQLLIRMRQAQIMAEIAATPRFKDPLRLLASGYKAFSQNQEDGMIAEVFRRIGTTSKRFIEFGVQDGLECNSGFLLMQGWRGAWIEGAADNAARARTA